MAGLLTSNILNLPYLFYQIIFSLFLKSGRRPLKWWRFIQIPCRYEKAIFCFTETKTYYRYLKFLAINNYSCYHHKYIVLFVLCIPFSLSWPCLSVLNACQCSSSHSTLMWPDSLDAGTFDNLSTEMRAMNNTMA